MPTSSIGSMWEKPFFTGELSRGWWNSPSEKCKLREDTRERRKSMGLASCINLLVCYFCTWTITNAWTWLKALLQCDVQTSLGNIHFSFFGSGSTLHDSNRQNIDNSSFHYLINEKIYSNQLTVTLPISLVSVGVDSVRWGWLVDWLIKMGMIDWLIDWLID